MSLSEPLTSVDVDADSSYAKMGNGGEKHDTFSAPSTPSTSTAVSTLRAHRIAIAVLSVLFLTAVIFAIIFASRSPATDTVLTPAPTSTGSAYVPVETEALREIGRDMDYSRDLTANPCEHWYQYACGGWTAKQPQGNFTSITKGFTLARLDNVQYVRQILMEDWPIITPLFQSCMNNEAIEAAGVQPLQGLLDLFNPNSSWITAASDVFFQLGRLRTSQRLTALVSATQTANQTAPTQPLLNLGFGGLTVTAMNGQVWPSYIGARNTTARMVQGIAEVLQAIGDPAPWAWAWARAVVDFETAMVNITARAQINSQGPMNFEQELAEERRLAAYNGMYSFEAAQALAPSLPLMSFLMGTGIPDVLKRAGTPPMAFIADADAFPLMADLISRTPVATLLAYARWRVVNVSMPYLAWSTRQVHHDYFGDDEMTLALPNDYTYCSGQVVSTLADDLFGRYFVSLRLQPEKARVAHNLMTWVRQAFERNLPSVSWMDDDTRKVALEKANAMIELVGGPEDGNWGDYSQVTIKRDTWYNNWVQMQGMRANDEWVQLTRPISRARFSMNPSLVNAQYSSRANAMTFPAAILQAPFFDFDYPMSVNLGRIGMVMGHEMIHGFDNNGRQFDKEGVRREWWDPSVIQAFRSKTQCLISEYDGIVVQGTHVNGTFTLGENIADNGGLHMAYLALQWYKELLANQSLFDPVPINTVAPLTSDQLFYWANAQTWCTKATDAAIATQIRTDVHSPGEARVEGPIYNQEGFAKAFNCPVGSRMNPAVKCDLY